MFTVECNNGMVHLATGLGLEHLVIVLRRRSFKFPFRFGVRMWVGNRVSVGNRLWVGNRERRTNGSVQFGTISTFLSCCHCCCRQHCAYRYVSIIHEDVK